MGLFDWFPFIRRKGYDPVQLSHTAIGSLLTTGRRRFDVLGSCFPAIRDAYSKHSQKEAHKILQKEIERYGTSTNMSLYLDGPQAVEKSATAEARESKRQKAIEKLSDSLDTFEMRINTGSRVRKRHYDDIKKGLGSSFYWSLDSRKDFAQHMTEQGWIAEVCDTEADVKIARDAQPGDIIISGDSDMLGYANIHTLWRPVSKSAILVYSLPDILKTIGFSRAQLTALAVVSKNDYQRNIKGLGPASNFGVIKKIERLLDPRLIVAAYLSDPTVITKNELEATFKDSIRVFIEMRQQVMNPLRPNPTQAVYHALQERFQDLCQKRESLKDVKGSEAQPTPVEEPIVRLRVPRSFNRYRTVESPANVAKDTRAPSPPPEDSGHPALARTRIPRHRERFSFQERTRKKLHAPPPRMKQMTLKFYKQPPEASAKSPPKPKTNFEKAPASAKKPLTEMKKVGLVRSLAWRHPTVSLEVGTINANTKRVFLGGQTSTTPSPTTPGSIAPFPTTPTLSVSDLQCSVVECLQECSRLAADKKREAQRLIGIFVETLRIRMDSAEEALRIKLPPGKLTVSEEKRTKARRDAVSDTERKIFDHLCERIKPKDDDEDDDKDATDKKRENNSDLDEKANDQEGFFLSFLTFLYSGNYPRERDLKGFGARDLLPKDKDDDGDKDKGKREKTSPGIVVNYLIDWLVTGHFYKPSRRRGEIEVKMPYTPTYVVRSVAGQLAVELKKLYGNGSHELRKKVLTMQKKGVLDASIDIGIQEQVSAVENFLFLNKLTSNSRRIVPLTASQQPFVSFSERELGSFFWKREVLKQRLCELALQDSTVIYNTEELNRWIGSKEPGFIIKHFICDVGSEGLTSRQKKKAGHRAAVRLWTLDDIRSHLQQFLREDEKKIKKNIKDDDEGEFHPDMYKEKGYVLRGSILTDGFRVKLLSFKLRELQDVRYRRWREDRLPSRLTSTVGGIDFFLQEIRNVLTCKEDIERLWPGVDVKDIRTLTLDAGQACIVGAFAHLPEEIAKKVKGKEIAKDLSSSDMEGVVATRPLDPASVSTSSVSSASTMASLLTPLDTSGGSSSNDSGPRSAKNVSTPSISSQPSTANPALSPRPVFFNLAVKAKAVYQPTLKFRRWTKSEKDNIPVGEDRSITDIETHLPPLRGPSASTIDYIKEVEQVEERLKAFYNGPDGKYKRNHWDMQRARHGEFQLIAHRLLGIVGGGLGILSDPSKPVIIGVGLGKFGTKSGLTSLHSTFLSYFVPLARSLGYLVVGLNEYYTSKKCPGCGQFVGQVDMRRFYCSQCQVFHHRDVMAAENMANIVQGYVLDLQRPDYLHPIAPDGSMPWKEASSGLGTPSTTGSTATNTAAASGPTKVALRSKGQRKRSSTAPSLKQAPSKSARY